MAKPSAGKGSCEAPRGSSSHVLSPANNPSLREQLCDFGGSQDMKSFSRWEDRQVVFSAGEHGQTS